MNLHLVYAVAVESLERKKRATCLRT